MAAAVTSFVLPTGAAEMTRARLAPAPSTVLLEQRAVAGEEVPITCR